MATTTRWVKTPDGRPSVSNQGWRARTAPAGSGTRVIAVSPKGREYLVVAGGGDVFPAGAASQIAQQISTAPTLTSVVTCEGWPSGRLVGGGDYRLAELQLVD